MIDFLMNLYWNCNFFVYLLVAMCLLCFPVPRRKWFVLRMGVSVIAGVALTYGYSWLLALAGSNIYLWTVFYCLKYFVCFAFACGCVAVSFSMPLAKILYYGISGYAIQHFSYSVFMIVDAVLDINGIVLQEFTPPFLLLEFSVMLVIFLLVFFFYGKYIRRATEDLQGKKLILPFALMLGAAAVLSVFCTGQTGEVRILLSCYALLLCATMLFAMYQLHEVGRLLYEKKTIRAVAVKQKEQYEMQKRNIDYINIKCHDLRRQLELLRGGKVSDEKLQEMQRGVSIYDSFAHTGNETLDVILSDKGLYCEQEGIRFTCMADGAKLNFLDAVDLCAIFCNLLDNAIEAVMQVQEKDQRMISLKVTCVGNLVHIGIFNNYAHVEGQGTFQTTKQNAQEHGFGLKSVRMAVEQYKGEMKVYAKNGVFNVNILLPVPAAK